MTKRPTPACSLRLAIKRFSEKSAEARKKYPVVNQDGVYYYFPRNEYVDISGKLIYDGSINKEVRFDILIDGLQAIGSQSAYDLMLDHFGSWMAREEGSLMNSTELYLKERRYNSPVIGIYDALFNDERLHPDTRNRIITALFSNEPVHYSEQVYRPEEFYPQIDELDQERLIRLLDIAEDALGHDFLTPGTIKLLESKRGEILQLLSAVGYDPDRVKEMSVEISVAMEVEPKGPAEVAPVKVVTESPEQPSQWWLWFVGGLVVADGLGLALRRKN